MSERKRRRRPARAQRTIGAINQRSWKQLQYHYQPMEIISQADLEQIHQAAPDCTARSRHYGDGRRGARCLCRSGF